ncbi:MAG TPA: T9SS type A sorting domain-containing protein, partial [Flavobacteriales bacterium]|nr:T9SS type A sorting domain-containing protein [Flavobacteriales bacterium]
INFFRFPATSNTQDTIQVGTFDSLDATNLNNFAGKYRALYGTPFDLQELTGISGLDVNAVTHIKVIDVVGNIGQTYCTYDQYGNKVNDPWPTAFPTGGFDLEAIGVINNWMNSVAETDEPVFGFYPNPTEDFIHIVGQDAPGTTLCINTPDGKILYNGSFMRVIDVSMFPKGIYLVGLTNAQGCFMRKLVKR